MAWTVFSDNNIALGDFSSIPKNRYFIQLSGGYYQLGSAITYTGDFEVGGKFTMPSGVFSYSLIGHDETNRVDIDSTSERFRFINGGDTNTFNGALTGLVAGSLNSWYVTLSGTTLELFINDISKGTAFTTTDFTASFIGTTDGLTRLYFGIEADVYFINKLSSPVSTTFKINTPTGSVENSLEGNNTLNYVGVPESERELYQLSSDRSQWDNINPVSQILPSPIVITGN